MRKKLIKIYRLAPIALLAYATIEQGLESNLYRILDKVIKYFLDAQVMSLSCSKQSGRRLSCALPFNSRGTA
jgi:hypothetical protein